MVTQLTTRPLWAFSNFVVEELPSLLAEDVERLPSKITSWINELDETDLVSVRESESRPLALLDLKMAEVAITRTSPENGPFPVPERLSKIIDWFCDPGGIGGLQYHELVEVNPPDDMRVFTLGSVGGAEKQFYTNHRLVEDRFRRIIYACDSFLSDPKGHDALLANHESLFDFEPIRRLMKSLYDMDPKFEFEVFRRFLMKPCPFRNVMGPSGAYTWRVPYFESLIWGKNISDEYHSQIEKNLAYFSIEGRTRLKDFCDAGDVPCIMDYAANSYNVVDALWNEIAFMESFRGMHHGLVRKQLPEVYAGNAEGTGTTDTKVFLENRRHSMHELYEKFKQEHPRA